MVSTISRSFVSIGRKKHATDANKAANPYTAVANIRDDCIRTYRVITTKFVMRIRDFWEVTSGSLVDRY
jgi:hypothetical protein